MATTEKEETTNPSSTATILLWTCSRKRQRLHLSLKWIEIKWNPFQRPPVAERRKTPITASTSEILMKEYDFYLSLSTMDRWIQEISVVGLSIKGACRTECRCRWSLASTSKFHRTAHWLLQRCLIIFSSCFCTLWLW